MKAKREVTKFNFSVDPTLHRRVKMAATASDRSMQALIVEAVEEKLAAEAKKGKKGAIA